MRQRALLIGIVSAVLMLVSGCQAKAPTAPSGAATVQPGVAMASRYTDTTFVASRGYIMPAIIDRNNNQLAISFHPSKTIWAPALFKYSLGPFVIKEDRGVKEWTLCIMDNNASIAPQAGQDLDVQVIPDRRLDLSLTGIRLIQINDWLVQTDFGVVALEGQTTRDVLKAVLIALRHSPDAADEL